MRTTFKILFYAKKNALLRNGEAPIMGRITINGERAQFSTRLSVIQEIWDTKQGCVTGRNQKAMRINEQLGDMRFRIEQCYNTLFYTQRHITPKMVRGMFLGEVRKEEYILAFFRQHNEEFRQMVGVNRSQSTYYKYRCVLRHLEKFITQKYQCKDLQFAELEREFLMGFHAYMAKECACRKNTTWIYMIAFKHILMLARSKGYLSKDLFANYKLQSEFVSRNYLTMEEINSILRLEILDITQALVRDAFIFSCFTGLSFIDICRLTMQHIKNTDNQLWISTTRSKTGAEVNVRLFAVPCDILSKYAPESPDVPIFPMPSNGWSNECLQKIMLEIGITRHITFHTARHTFATTITLSQGVAIETISKLLGHRNIKTTQIYATITHSKLNGEMDRLSKRINALCCI